MYIRKTISGSATTAATTATKGKSAGSTTTAAAHEYHIQIYVAETRGLIWIQGECSGPGLRVRQSINHGIYRCQTFGDEVSRCVHGERAAIDHDAAVEGREAIHR